MGVGVYRLYHTEPQRETLRISAFCFPVARKRVQLRLHLILTIYIYIYFFFAFFCLLNPYTGWLSPPPFSSICSVF